jgi:hypothetical protein
MMTVLISLFIPIIAGLVYFYMAYQVHVVSQYRKLIFGELAYKKVFWAFLMFGVYFISRPLQMLNPYPWPMIINSIRQFFLMAIISPAILIGIFHWVPDEKGTPRSTVFAAYFVGLCTATIFILVNSIAIHSSKVIGSFAGLTLYDGAWFISGNKDIRLVVIHLLSQLISPVGFLFLAASYVRHKRHTHPLISVYTLLKLKWKYIEMGLVVFVIALLAAGLAAFLGSYYTYIWVIYFVAAIVAGLIETKGVTMPLVETPKDLIE